MLDGQQRITSIGRFVTNKFAIMDNGNPKNFDSLPADQQAKIRDSKLLIYECEGTESEIKKWFETINIAGVPLNDQELLERHLLRAVRDACEGRVQQQPEREHPEMERVHQGRA